MKAYEMFKKLGYSVYLKEELLVYTLKYGFRTIKKIIFFLSKHEINVGGGEKTKWKSLTAEETKAVYQQMAELGWLADE